MFFRRLLGLVRPVDFLVLAVGRQEALEVSQCRIPVVHVEVDVVPVVPFQAQGLLNLGRQSMPEVILEVAKRVASSLLSSVPPGKS